MDKNTQEYGVEQRISGVTELESLRSQLAELDAELAKLFECRMGLACKVAELKQEKGLPIEDLAQEARVIERGMALISNEELRLHYAELLQKLIEISKEVQDDYLELKK